MSEQETQIFCTDVINSLHTNIIDQMIMSVIIDMV